MSGTKRLLSYQATLTGPWGGHVFVLRYATSNDTLRKMTASLPMITAKSLSSVLDTALNAPASSTCALKKFARHCPVSLRQPCASDLHTLRDEFPAFLRVRLLAFSYYVEHSIVDRGQLRLSVGVLGRFLYGRFDLF
ncbi:hypothetical protein Lferr_2790 [Acidithiobacillus ferrooxidans ATCC 53993]|nr:hypothetical protein Lferr_2790 [Acidithiobacillus ferrooxidans ATCC 53993]